MTNVNVFTIIGRLTADAEEFTIGNNTYVGFRVAVDRGQNKESSFLPVRAPKKFISDNLRAKLIKGAPVLVTGRFESGSYDKDGQKKYYTYLSAATIQHDVNGNFADGMLMGNLTAVLLRTEITLQTLRLPATALTRRMGSGLMFLPLWLSLPPENLRSLSQANSIRATPSWLLVLCPAILTRIRTVKIVRPTPYGLTKQLLQVVAKTLLRTALLLLQQLLLRLLLLLHRLTVSMGLMNLMPLRKRTICPSNLF